MSISIAIAVPITVVVFWAGYGLGWVHGTRHERAERLLGLSNTVRRP